MAAYKDRVKEDLDRWIASGLVAPDKREAILATLPEARRLDAATALAWVGGVLLGIAVIAFVAANWDGMPKLARFAVLLVSFLALATGGAWAALVALLRDPRVRIGGSDGGAHVDTISGYAMYTGFLADAVRKHQLLSFEEAIAHISSAPARLYGLRGRGTLAVGGAADIVIFDPDRIGSPLRPTPVKDLPAGGSRLYCKAEGIERVIVNGQTLYRSGTPTGARAGKVLRSNS